MNVTVKVYESDNATLVGEIVPGQFASAQGAHIPLKGAGTLVLLRIWDSPTNGLEPNPALALIEDKRLIRFTGDFGTWTMEVEDSSDVVVSPEKEAGELVTIKGRDWLTARTAKASVHPDAGYGVLPWVPDRFFNVAADRLRDDDPAGPQGVWPFAVNTPPDYDGANLFGRPEGMVNTDPQWLWSEDSTTSVPGGVCYFRQRFTLATTQDVYFEFAADDEGELWVDDVQVTAIEGVYKGGCVTAVLKLSAGDHLVAVVGRNLNALRAGVTASWWSVSDGMPDTMLGELTESACRVLAYPTDPPGFTPPESIRLVVDENQTLGFLLGVICNFTSASDTAGAAVTEVTDLSCRAPDTSVLTFLQMVAASYLDIDGQPTNLKIDCWIRGTRGSDKTATVVLEKGTAKSVKHDRSGSERATVAAVTGDNFAPFLVEHPDVATLGKTSVPLNFGNASQSTAAKWAAEYLEVIAEGRRGIAVEVGPGGPVPGADFDIGDLIGVLETDGTVGPHRVSGWSFKIDASSVVTYSVELDQPAAVQEERLSAIMRRFTPGGAGGRTILPSPTDPNPVSTAKGSEKSKTWSAPTTGTVVLTKNGTPIPGASISGTGKVTLTDAAREFVRNSDQIDITIDGVAGTDAPWKPTDGRWLQEFSVNATATGVSIEVKYL